MFNQVYSGHCAQVAKPQVPKPDTETKRGLNLTKSDCTMRN